MGQGWILELEKRRMQSCCLQRDGETKRADRIGHLPSGDAETLYDEGPDARVGQTAFGWWPRKAVSTERSSGSGRWCVRRAGALLS